MNKINRRQFMKKAIAVGATITAFPASMPNEVQAEKVPPVVVHPNVNNLRVVGMTDPKMTTSNDPVSAWATQDQLVSKEVVWENMDILAGGLAEVSNPTEAWHSIFMKPPGKSWSDTTVAIKTNNLGRQHTRSAVMAKICHTLTGTLGVQPSNIIIYDACHGRSMDKKTAFSGLPENCRIENKWGGSSARTPIPAPWKNGLGEAKCLEHLVNGSVDILVNIAMCKGHSQKFGGFTMTMKNHFGTFDPRPGHMFGGADYLLAINKTPEILGEMEKQTGQVLFPRQQLCLVDALWASEKGPGCASSRQPNFLAMGVLAPVVDHIVATRFRGETMGWQPNREMTNRMLTEFGYNKSDLIFGGKIIEV
jgi:hypothetical protein